MAALFTAVVIFLNLLDMAFSVNPADLARVARQRGLVLRAALSVLVVVPVFALAVSYIDAIPWPTRVALGLLACAPGAPLGAKRAAQLGSTLATGMGLQLIVALAGVITAPLTLVLMASLHGFQEWVPVREVVWQVFTVQALPLGIGMLLVWRYPKRMARFSKPLSLIANLSMLLLVLLTLVVIVKTIPTLDLATVLAMIAMAGVALAAGHLLGGPSHETRAATAVASANRNLGLAIFLGSFVRAHPANLVMIFAMVNFFVGAAYKAITRPKG